MVLLSKGDASLFNLFKVDLWAASFSDFDAFFVFEFLPCLQSRKVVDLTHYIEGLLL